MGKDKFAEPVNRRQTNSVKWDMTEEVFGRDDILPMWVADSDWPTAEVVRKALRERIEQGIIGYTFPGKELNGVIKQWVGEQYEWEIKKEWIVHTAGVVPSLNVIIRTFTIPGDEVVLQPPVYYPFFSAVKNSGAHIVNNQLRAADRGYKMDFKGLENLLAREESRVKLLVLCSPHNPVGRVWTRTELKRLGSICRKYDVLLIADEIHADFVFFNNRHLPLAAVDDELARNSLTLLAPSKTFNIAGLNTSFAVIPDPALRRRFNKARDGLLKESNALGLTAMKAAYKEGAEWMEAQNEYLEENIIFACNYIKNRLPQIEVLKPEGTYLLWMDCRKLASTQKKISDFFINQARVALDDGAWFGPGGEGFMRLNLACPRSLLETGLNRIKGALDKNIKGSDRI